MPSPIDPRENSPLDGALLVDPGKRFSAACLNAVREFRRAKPWRGTTEERMTKFRSLHVALCDTYGIVPPPELRFIGIGEAAPEQIGTGAFNAQLNTVAIAGRLSVASYLWAFGRARGLDVEESFRWSLSLFARMFPRSYAQCRFEGPYLVRDNNQNL
jgi:hypothetical protein